MNDVERAIESMEKITSGEIVNKALLTVHQQVKKRIFTDGKTARGTKIGTYSDSYMKTRRKKGLGPNRNIILEFTGQMRRDFIPMKRNGVIVGSGFSNNYNDKKSRWVERRLKKTIFELTPSERRLIDKLIQNQIDRL